MTLPDTMDPTGKGVPPVTDHGTAVLIGGKGILIRGPSGSGKSSLALRLLDDSHFLGAPAFLIADDRVILTRAGERITLHAVDRLRGLLEVRGLGLITVDSVREAPLDLVVDLVPPDALVRYPEEGGLGARVAGVHVPRLFIAERNPDAPAIIRSYFRTRPAPLTTDA